MTSHISVARYSGTNYIIEGLTNERLFVVSLQSGRELNLLPFNALFMMKYYKGICFESVEYC